MRAFRGSLRHASERGEFRVVHYSVQHNHVHLLVESAGKEALGRGMKAVAARLARAVNRVFRRSGPALDGRYHLRVLRTPLEVRRALAYVLLNARKHWRERHGAAPPVRLDDASSARWFDGWTRRLSRDPSRTRSPIADNLARAGPQVVASSPPEVSRPRTWLLARGWRRHGLVDPAETPGAWRSRARSRRREST